MNQFNKLTVAALLLFLAFSCQKQIREEDEFSREEAFRNLSFESTNPKRRASLELTKQGLKESERGFYMRAMKKYEKAIDVDSSNPFAYFHYAVSRLNIKQYDQSLSLFDEARDKFKDNKFWLSRVFMYRGVNYLKLGNEDLAKENFLEALKLDKKNYKARDMLESIDR